MTFMSDDIRLSYKDAPDRALIVRLVRSWDRGDIDAPIMSASSGPKAYVKNMVFALFESNAAIDAVLMVCGGGPPFLLVRVGNIYFDMIKREVVAEGLCMASA
jgi:hypothetical protein